MDDSRWAPEFSFDTDVAFPERSESLSEGILWIEASILETRKEIFGSRTHAFDNWRVQSEIQFPFMRLCASADEKNVFVARHNKYNFMFAFGSNDQGIFDFGKVLSVVDDSDEGTSDWIAGIVASELGTSETGSVDNDISVESRQKLLFNVDKVSGDSFRDKRCSLSFDKSHQPGHCTISVDDRRQMFVGIDNAIIRIDSAFMNEIGTAHKTFDGGCFDFQHLFKLQWIIFDTFTEEKVGSSHPDARCIGEFRIGGDGRPDIIGDQAPSFRVQERDGIGMLATDSRRIFPESASNL